MIPSYTCTAILCLCLPFLLVNVSCSFQVFSQYFLPLYVPDCSLKFPAWQSPPKHLPACTRLTAAIYLTVVSSLLPAKHAHSLTFPDTAENSQSQHLQPIQAGHPLPLFCFQYLSSRKQQRNIPCQKSSCAISWAMCFSVLNHWCSCCYHLTCTFLPLLSWPNPGILTASTGPTPSLHTWTDSFVQGHWLQFLAISPTA